MEGLLQYERDTNLSPQSVIESLVEDFLIKKGYLVISNSNEFISFPSELNKPPLKHTYDRGNGVLRIYYSRNGRKDNYGSTSDYNKAKIIVEFLKSKEWDLKYSVSQTKLKGKKQIEFLLSEIEKESELVGTE